MNIARGHPSGVFPNRTRLQRVVISGNHEHRTWHASEPIDDITNQLPTDSVMFEGIPGQDEKVGRFFPANLGDAPTGVQSDRSHPISDGANLYRSHSDLPITRMHKPHTEIMHQEVAHGMSYLENFFSTG